VGNPFRCKRECHCLRQSREYNKKLKKGLTTLLESPETWKKGNVVEADRWGKRGTRRIPQVQAAKKNKGNLERTGGWRSLQLAKMKEREMGIVQYPVFQNQNQNQKNSESKGSGGKTS